MYYRISPYNPRLLPQMVELYNSQTRAQPHVARLTEDLFTQLVQAKSCFDPQGLLVATGSRHRVLGWVHACIAPGSESWHKPDEPVARIRMLVFSPEHLELGTDLVQRATQWLSKRGHTKVLAMHAQKGYPLYRGLWFGFEPMCPATLPHLHAALEIAGYKITQQSLFMTAPMPQMPPPQETKVPAAFESGPATMAHEPMRESWVGFEPRTISLRVDGQYAGAIHWALQPHLADKLGAPCMNIWGLGVHESHRRKGLAVALISRAMAEAFERGARFASVGTQLANAPAHATYARMGYLPDTVLIGRELNPQVARPKEISMGGKVAVAQISPVLFDPPGTLAKVAQFAAQAAARGAKLLLFPEATIPAYPRGLAFGTVVGVRRPEGRRLFQRYADTAVAVPGPITEQLGRIARQTATYLVIGVIERDSTTGGTLYCTILFFGPDGQLLGKHRKIKPTAAERIIWGEGDGSTMPVIPTPLGKMGALVCWENYMPLARMALYAKGVELYLAPTADPRETWQPTIRHIALEGRCYVLACNQYVTKDMYPRDLEEYALLADLPQVLCAGGSAIISPLGEYLAGPLSNAEGILYADVDLALLTQARFDLDVAGHYNRPDIFQLTVNERPLSPTRFLS